MALIPLALPPGIYRNGTEFQAAGRWRDSNLVRWIDNTIRPVGGWRLRSDQSAVDPLRGAYAWKGNTAIRYLAAGSASQLVTYLDAGNLIDITPVDLVVGTVDGSVNTGYGGSFFGTGYYGVPRADAETAQPATTWSLDNWGEYLVACSSADGRIFQWELDRTTPTPAAPINTAPTNNQAIVVTEERFIFALGAGGNPRKVAWCDRENNTVWTPLAENEAGDIELQTSGFIRSGHRVQGQTLILTDMDAHIATYIGGQFVYGFERVGTACGVISNLGAAVTPVGCIWMGRNNFYIYAGGSVQELPSEVDDFVFSSINRTQRSKIAAVVNRKFNEIWWFYPSEASVENDRYVVYNYKENIWFIGNMGRTCGVDIGVFTNPIFFCSVDRAPFDHEYGFNYGTVGLPWAETGAISIGNGDNVAVMTEMIPDEKTQGDVQVKFKTRFHPNDVEREYGPYSMSNPTSLRVTGRQLRMRVEGVALADWRVGTNRIDVKPGGRR